MTLIVGSQTWINVNNSNVNILLILTIQFFYLIHLT